MRSRLPIALAVFTTALMFPASAWAAVSFAPAANYGVGDRPLSVAVGDLDGDNVLDLAVTNIDSDIVSVLLGNGDGTFAAAVNYGVGDGPYSVAIGDLDGDNDLDLAVTNIGPDNVSVLLGNGDGTFAAAVNYGTGDAPYSVAIGDLDGDNDLDLAIANLGSYNVSVLLGNGDGTFAAAVNYGVDVFPYSVAIGDLDGDNDLDLAVANSGNDNVSVLLGNGDGTFAAATSHGAGDGPAAVAIGDLDSDGKLDLAVANLVAGSVSVLQGNGDGTFAAANNFGVGSFPQRVALGDFNGDSRTDLATANEGSDNVSVLLNTPNFTTGPTATISGTVRQGQTLTAHEGTPDPTPDSFTYKWFADGVEIVGQTANTLLLTSAQVGKKISVEVTAHKTGLTDASDTSPETVPVVGIFTPGPTATIGGYARIGSTLTAYIGSPSPTPTSFTYRWYANGTLLSNTARTLQLTTAHYGKRIQVKVTAKKSDYQSASSLSAATATVSNLQAKTISMKLNDYTVYRGQRVYAEIERLAPGEAWSIVLDGKKLASGKASAKGIAVTGLTIPSTATKGERIIRANGIFPDRTDPDRIIVR